MASKYNSCLKLGAPVRRDQRSDFAFFRPAAYKRSGRGRHGISRHISPSLTPKRGRHKRRSRRSRSRRGFTKWCSVAQGKAPKLPIQADLTFRPFSSSFHHIRRVGQQHAAFLTTSKKYLQKENDYRLRRTTISSSSFLVFFREDLARWAPSSIELSGNPTTLFVFISLISWVPSGLGRQKDRTPPCSESFSSPSTPSVCSSAPSSPIWAIRTRRTRAGRRTPNFTTRRPSACRSCWASRRCSMAGDGRRRRRCAASSWAPPPSSPPSTGSAASPPSSSPAPWASTPSSAAPASPRRPSSSASACAAWSAAGWRREGRGRRGVVGLCARASYLSDISFQRGGRECYATWKNVSRTGE